MHMSKILAICFTAVFLFATAARVHAGPYEDALAAHKQGDYERAASIIKPLAESGNRAAQAVLGVLYDKGQGVKQDHTKAVHWSRLSADAGYARAQYNLGVYYANGHGVAQDFEKAEHWFQLAAAQGHKGAQDILNRMNP